MAYGVSTFGHVRTARAAALATSLAQRRDLPLRVRGLLGGLPSLCSNQLVRPLGAALDEFERDLLTQAGKERDSGRSQRLFESLRQFRRVRIDAGPKFLAAIEQRLARFDLDEAGDDPQQSSELSLVEAKDLDETLALQETASRSEVRLTFALHDLGHRFAVLAALPAFDVDRVPLGPARLLDALRDAARQLNVPADHRLLLYVAFDRVVMGKIESFYASLNSYLADQHILKHLRVHAPPRKGSKGAADAPAKAPPPAAPEARPAAAAGDVAVDPADARLFATLRNLLAAGKPAREPAGPRAAARYVPSADDLQSVLGLLQSGAAPAAAAGSSAAQRSIRQFKQDLLGHLQRFAPPGKTPELNSEDSDTIDLVGMLFEQIARTAPERGSTRTMLSQLQVPLLRVALRDKGFFSERSHPARLLLNAIAETGIHWIDDAEGESDPLLQKKMHAVIQRLNNEFDGSLSLIERMLGDLTQHMTALKRKAELTEKHLVDASRGREKLAIARQTASEAIAARIAAAKPGRLLRTMLEQAWTDVLALTLLRQGEDGEGYRRQLAIADQLIAAGTSGRRSGPADAALRRDVEKGLAQVGYHPDEIHAVVGHLLAPDSAQDENPASQTEVAMRLKSKAHLGEPVRIERPLHAERKSPLPPSAEELRTLEHLKTLPFGTWFEFAVNQQGDRLRRKLSWYSTVTGHCLFVNPRGARAFERTLQQLARDIVKGQANIAPPEQESLVDRAWKAIVASLRQLTTRTSGAHLTLV